MAPLFDKGDIVIITSDYDRLKHLQGTNYSEEMIKTLGEIGIVRRIRRNTYLKVSFGVPCRYDYHPLAVTKVDLPYNGSAEEELKIRQLLNKPNRNGFTILHIAAKEGKIDVVRMLLELGCDGSGRNTYSETHNAVAIRRNNTVDSYHNEESFSRERATGEIAAGFAIGLKYTPGGPLDVNVQGSLRMDPETLVACLPLMGPKFMMGIHHKAMKQLKD